jgi:hypothetical protein
LAVDSDRDQSLSWGRKMLKPMLVPIRLELNERPRLNFYVNFASK